MNEKIGPYPVEGECLSNQNDQTWQSDSTTCNYELRQIN